LACRICNVKPFRWSLSCPEGKPSEMQTGKAIRSWLEEAVAHAGVSATEVARRAGLNQTTITKFMNERRGGSMRVATLRKIAHATGYDLPRELDPLPPVDVDETEIVLALGELLPKNKPLSEADRLHISREILGLVRRRLRGLGRAG